jgi:hypothetical protein
MTLSDFFNAVQATLPARRGNLYEQYMERAGADGKTKRYGPYYVWTRCENGKMVSSRVSRQDAPRVREEIARGKELCGLIDQLWKLAEELAQTAEPGKKKRAGKSTRRRLR